MNYLPDGMPQTMGGRPDGSMYAQTHYYQDQPAMYGSFQGKAAAPAAFVRGQRKRMNLVSIVVALFLPWGLFSVLFAVMSFSMHYQQPIFAYAFVGLGFVVVLACGLFAVDAAKKKAAGDPRREPTWFIFIFITTLLAWLIAVVCGDINFFHNMQPFYDVNNLNVYPDVDPSIMRGQQLMDAGRIVFSSDSKLDLRKSIGFKNLDLFCVAPITTGNANVTHQTLASYDFWAVGVNCCSGNMADFHCGEFNNPRAHAGLRLMRDDERAFFRLAVQQAEAAYNIKAVHPLFFTWMQDPIAEINAYQDEGYKHYLLGMFSYFSFQLFLVVCATIAFTKMGQM